MTKTEYLNLASDLHRAAYWTAINKNKKLVAKILKEIKLKSEIRQILGINYHLKANLLAEELLLASQKLQRIA